MHLFKDALYLEDARHEPGDCIISKRSKAPRGAGGITAAAGEARQPLKAVLIVGARLKALPTQRVVSEALQSEGEGRLRVWGLGFCSILTECRKRSTAERGRQSGAGLFGPLRSC